MRKTPDPEAAGVACVLGVLGGVGTEGVPSNRSCLRWVERKAVIKEEGVLTEVAKLSAVIRSAWLNRSSR